MFCLCYNCCSLLLWRKVYREKDQGRQQAVMRSICPGKERTQAIKVADVGEISLNVREVSTVKETLDCVLWQQGSWRASANSSAAPASNSDSSLRDWAENSGEEAPCSKGCCWRCSPLKSNHPRKCLPRYTNSSCSGRLLDNIWRWPQNLATLSKWYRLGVHVKYKNCRVVKACTKVPERC